MALAQNAPEAEIDQLLERGFAALKTGNYPEMARLGAEALRLSTAAHDQRRMTRAILLTGSASYSQGRLLEALDELKQPLAWRLSSKPETWPSSEMRWSRRWRRVESGKRICGPN